MKTFKVKIIKCSSPVCWYKYNIGETYLVRESIFNLFYERIYGKGNRIFKSDCEIIGE